MCQLSDYFYSVFFFVLIAMKGLPVAKVSSSVITEEEKIYLGPFCSDLPAPCGCCRAVGVCLSKGDKLLEGSSDFLSVAASWLRSLGEPELC